MTFEELYQLRSGTTVDSWDDEGIKCLIVRGPGSLCAYLGIPKEHPCAGKHYDDIDLRVHGGLTFSQAGEVETPWDPALYWIGWDYAHYRDKTFYDLQFSYGHYGEHGWTDEEVKPQVIEAAKQYKELLQATTGETIRKTSEE